jgi:ABC-type transporter Mla MlaB component
MKNRALQYYMHDGPDAFRFELAGDLNQEGARRLAQAWRTASSMFPDGRLIVDMTFVTSVDEQGSALILQWHRDGVAFVANSDVSRGLIESVLGSPIPPRADTDKRSGRRFRPSILMRTVGALWLAAFLFPAEASAATCAPETRFLGITADR